MDLEPIREPSAERGTVPFCSQGIAKRDGPRRFSDRLLIIAGGATHGLPILRILLILSQNPWCPLCPSWLNEIVRNNIDLYQVDHVSEIRHWN